MSNSINESKCKGCVNFTIGMTDKCNNCPYHKLILAGVALQIEFEKKEGK